MLLAPCTVVVEGERGEVGCVGQGVGEGGGARVTDRRRNEKQLGTAHGHLKDVNIIDKN
jgi:hypothetical protein